MSSAPEALQVHYTADSVHRGVDALVSKDVDIQQSITQMKTQLLDIAATFQDLGAMDRVPGMRERYKELLVIDNDIGMHMQALQSLKTSYKPSSDSSDFSRLVQSKLDRLTGSQQFDPERSQEMKTFDKETGNATGGVSGDDDIEEVGDSGLRNDKCPICMKSVFDLAQPVADNVGIIYEKASIIDYLNRHARNGPVKCPMQGGELEWMLELMDKNLYNHLSFPLHPRSGTSHTVSERDLIPAMQLERAKRRKKVKNAMAQAGSSPAFDVDH